MQSFRIDRTESPRATRVKPPQEDSGLSQKGPRHGILDPIVARIHEFRKVYSWDFFDKHIVRWETSSFGVEHHDPRPGDANEPRLLQPPSFNGNRYRMISTLLPIALGCTE